MSFLKLLAGVPDILSYFIPGAVLMKVYSHFYLKRYEHSTLVFGSLFWSYIIKIATDSVYTFNSPEKYLVYMVVGLVVPFFIYWFGHDLANWFLDKTTHTSIADNIWYATVDFATNTLVSVYLNDGKQYLGICVEAGAEWITLKNYSQFKLKGDKDFKFFDGPHTDGLLNIPVKEIKYFETQYEDSNSKVKRKYILPE